MNVIRELRVYKLGKTQQEFANIVGVTSPAIVSYWEAGKAIPHPHNMKQILKLALDNGIKYDHFMENIFSAKQLQEAGPALNDVPELLTEA